MLKGSGISNPAQTDLLCMIEILRLDLLILNEFPFAHNTVWDPFLSCIIMGKDQYLLLAPISARVLNVSSNPMNIYGSVGLKTVAEKK